MGTTFKCPVCGAPLSVWGMGTMGAVQTHAMHDYGDIAQNPYGSASAPPFSSMQYPSKIDRPIAQPTAITHVVVPGGVGLLAFILLLVIMLIFATPGDQEWNWRLILGVPAIGSLVAALLMLYASNHTHWEHTEYKSVQVEPARPEKSKKQPTMRIEREKQGGGWQFDYLPYPKDDPMALYDFAVALARKEFVDGKLATFSERAAGHFGYSRDIWKLLATTFLNHIPPYAYDRGGRQGLELTTAGKRYVNSIAEAEPPDVE